MAAPRSILVLGASGMLGTALAKVIGEFPVLRYMGVDLDADITNRRNIDNAIRKYEAQIVINCAAMTDVDGCERNPMLAAAINSEGAENAALACHDAGAALVHVSTDFVFDGAGDRPYRETDAAQAVSVYGATKLEGERHVARVLPRSLVVRTAWTFGPGRPNFVTKVIDRARSGGPLEVVTDQVGSPTYTVDLARGILALTFGNAHGLFHVVNSGSCSRFELAQAVVRGAGLDGVEVKPIESSSLAAPSSGQPVARRPAYSVLDTSAFTKKTGISLPPWTEALQEYLGVIKTG